MDCCFVLLDLICYGFPRKGKYSHEFGINLFWQTEQMWKANNLYLCLATIKCIRPLTKYSDLLKKFTQQVKQAWFLLSMKSVFQKKCSE